MATLTRRLVELVVAVPGERARVDRLAPWLHEQLGDAPEVDLPGGGHADWAIRYTSEHEPNELRIPALCDSDEDALSAVRRAMADAPVAARSVRVDHKLELTRENIDAAVAAYALGRGEPPPERR